MMSAPSNIPLPASEVIDRLRPDTSVHVKFKPHGDTEERGAEPRFLIGYWSIRGLAAPLRMLLHAAKVDHIVAAYDLSEEEAGDGWTKSAYLLDREWIRSDVDPLVNLPFLVDRVNNVVVAQTNACFSYLGKELGMFGINKEQEAKCEELLCEIMDLRNVMVGYAYGGSPDAHAAAINSAKVHLEKLEQYIKFQLHVKSKNGGKKRKVEVSPYLVGDSFTSPDFHLFEMLDQFECLCEAKSVDLWGDQFVHLKQWKALFSSLPENKAYLDSQFHTEWPFNNSFAIFGSAPKAATYVRGQATPWKGQGSTTCAY